MNGKIKEENARSMKISEFIQKENIEEIYPDFERFWNLCIHDLDYLLMIESIDRKDQNLAISQQNSLIYCLPGDTKEQSFIRILIKHAINIQNLLKSQLTQLLKHEEKTNGSFTLMFPIPTKKQYSLPLFDLDVEEIERNLKNRTLDSSFLSMLESNLASQLTIQLKTIVPIAIKIDRFEFANSQEEEIIQIPQIANVEDYFEGLPTHEWDQIIANLEKNSQAKNCQAFIVQTLKAIQKIETSHLTKRFFEETIFDYVLNTLKNNSIQEIGHTSPTFQKVAKLKHIQFLDKKFKEYFVDPYQKIPKEFKQPFRQLYQENLCDAIKHLDVVYLAKVWKFFIENYLTEKIRPDKKLRELLSLTFFDDEEYDESIEKIEEYFPENIQAKHCVEAFKYFQKIASIKI
ncbi:hypothetical protein M0811_03238 [Anaeramoeba ignava]|uniref:Uncharacterized protein n=1 Tax=Anaeramoeba ignava TaxID=1746090 RepID=A0A9Q0R4G8_ANAIG|nr:hypothetical protein M0811_03238 [Anaeramoeba ignava]